MKVADIMQKHVDYVDSNTTILDVARIIFGRRINGVPVCKNKKAIGFITERDILQQFFPSIQELVEDFPHASDFGWMEDKVNEILTMPVSKIMTRNPTTVTAETPLLRAQSLMFTNKVGRLPVVDGKRNLVGIISKGDIFRAVVGRKVPYEEDEEYHDWLARHYDLLVKWETRLGNEIPDLTALFKKEKIKKVLDIGSGTGEHSLALAKQGVEITALETSHLMYNIAKEKSKKLSPTAEKRLRLVNEHYIEFLKDKSSEFGAAIFMGNALAHIYTNYKYKMVLQAVERVLLPKNSLIVIQLINFEKVFKTNKRFLDINFAKSRLAYEREHLFLEFYDPPRKKGGHLTLNMTILDFDGKRWSPWRLHSTPIAHITKEKVKPILQKLGFKKINFYGSMFLGPLFRYKFKPLEHDWLIVLAKR